jgi:hypothetical protein
LCVVFVGNPDSLLLIHKIARTYGRLPHEILALSAEEVALAVACVSQAEATEAQWAEQMGTVFPVKMVQV